VLDVPSVTLFDAALHYDFSALGPQYKGYSLQVNATNLFDETYVTLCSDNGCFYGLRRQVICNAALSVVSRLDTPCRPGQASALRRAAPSSSER
jgi:hypothetical protein